MNACTFWPDRWGPVDLSACCLAHDAAYDLGLDKIGADVALFHCIRGVAGWPLAVIMLLGVTLGGWLFFRRRRKAATPDERRG